MPHKLLLVDDSVTIQRVVQLTFVDEDVEVVTVGDGSRVIDAIREETPDIVLVDVDMPHKNGYEVTAFVKSGPAHDVPVILLTGAFNPVNEVQARKAGCDGILVKPFKPKQVIEKGRELLNSRGVTDSSRFVEPQSTVSPEHSLSSSTIRTQRHEVESVLAKAADSFIQGRGLSNDFIQYSYFYSPLQYPQITQPEAHYPHLYSLLIVPFYLLLGKTALAAKLPAMLGAAILLPIFLYLLVTQLSTSRVTGLAAGRCVMVFP